MLSVNHFSVLLSSSSRMLSNSTMSGGSFFDDLIFWQKCVPKNEFWDSDRQAGGNELPTGIKPLQLFVTLPMQ